MNNLDKYSDKELFQILDSDVESEIRKRGYQYGWYKPEQYAGDIYILVNPAFPSLVKIGYADDVTKRVKILNQNSGLPDPYHVYATYTVKKRLEDMKLHKLIDSLDSNLRHAKNREFYEMSPEKAYEILAIIAEINGNEDLLHKNPFNDEYFESITKQQITSEPTTLNAKPVTIEFQKGNDRYYNFTTWKNYLVIVIQKAIESYGESIVKEKLLDKNDKLFHTKKRSVFSDHKTDTMTRFGCFSIRSDLWVLTNYSANSIQKITAHITELFPDISNKLIYADPQ